MCEFCVHRNVAIEQTKASTSNEAEDDGEDVKVIDLGDPLPDIVVKNEKDEDVQVQDLTKEHGAVIFLVPKADTRTSISLSLWLRYILPTSARFSDFSIVFVSGLHDTSMWLPRCVFRFHRTWLQGLLPKCRFPHRAK